LEAYTGNFTKDMNRFIHYTEELFNFMSSEQPEPALKPDVHEGRAGVTTKPEITHPLDDFQPSG
jgi:hypothetical protein